MGHTCVGVCRLTAVVLAYYVISSILRNILISDVEVSRSCFPAMILSAEPSIQPL